jgi:hypothetical protein
MLQAQQTLQLQLQRLPGYDGMQPAAAAAMKPCMLLAAALVCTLTELQKPRLAGGLHPQL